MKKIAFAFLALFLSFSESIRSEGFSNILTNEDILLEVKERAEDQAAISTPKDDGSFEDSFNQWLCFSPNQVELINVEVIYDEESKYIPLLSIEGRDRYYEIAVDGDYKIHEPGKSFSEWKALLEVAHEVCAYAAFLQVSNWIEGKPNEAWIINRLKTDRGEWINFGEDIHEFDRRLFQEIESKRILEYQESLDV